MTQAKRLVYAVFVAALITVQSSRGRAQDDDLQKKLANPISSLTLVPIQTNFDFRVGPAWDGSRLTTNIQPVIPFALSGEVTLLTVDFKQIMIDTIEKHTGTAGRRLRSSDCKLNQLGRAQVWISNSPLISTGIPCGSSARPTAERACWPILGPSS
jgi:hypothetical protein